MRILRFFARHYPVHSAVVLLCLLLGAAMEVVGLSTVLPILRLAIPTTAGQTSAPGGIERALDAALAQLHWEPTPGLLLSLFVGAFVLKAGLVIVAKRQVGYTVADVATDLRLGLLNALLSARWRHYANLPAGRATNAITTETERASLAFHHLAEVGSFTMEAILYVTIASFLSLEATAAAIAAVGTSLTLLTVLVRRSGRAGKKQTRFLRSLASGVADALGAVKMLKSMGREPLIEPMLADDTRQLNRALRRRIFSKEALRALQEPILAIFVAGGLYLGAVVRGMPMAELALLGFLFSRAFSCANMAQRRYQSLAAEASALWSLREMIDQAEQDREVMAGTRPPTLERGITLSGASVAYRGHPVLDGVDLTLPAGEFALLLGASGAGKTTIADLITGLVRPDSGGVAVDGVPLAELDLAAWRRMIGYVPQETLLLHASIATNVTLGDPELDEADVEAALRDAGAWQFVSELPEGIHSSVGERGTLFSGGQRQRIAVARALVHGAQLLIMDEATASLDSASEAAVWKTLERLRGRVTLLGVSHRPELACYFDRTYRLESGRLVELDPAAPQLPLSR